MAIFHFGQAEAERWLTAEHEEHKAQLEALRAGRWPDTAAGRKIAGLADRVGPEATRRMRRYWELQAWLVAEAEETMLEEEAGDAKFDAGEIRAVLAELQGLKQALGKSTFVAFNALLPFSRNDSWEVSELRQRLGRK
jgi:hypothetical protein